MLVAVQLMMILPSKNYCYLVGKSYIVASSGQLLMLLNIRTTYISIAVNA